MSNCLHKHFNLATEEKNNVISQTLTCEHFKISDEYISQIRLKEIKSTIYIKYWTLGFVNDNVTFHILVDIHTNS